MRALVVFVACVFALFTTIGSAATVPELLDYDNNGRIMGGQPTTIDKYPFMAAMLRHFSGFFYVQLCGGTLITSSSVLSAANCFYGELPREWQVRLGSSWESAGGLVFPVSELLLHPQYLDATQTHDIAIVFMATAAPISDTIQTIPIAGPDFWLPDGISLTVIGWGALTPTGPYPSQLHEVNYYTINHDICKFRYAYLKTQPSYAHYPDVDSSMLCTGVTDVEGADACQGDDGGPVLRGGSVLVGVVSWRFRCGHPYYPGVNAHVARLAHWIVDNGSV